MLTIAPVRLGHSVLLSATAGILCSPLALALAIFSHLASRTSKKYRY